MGILFKTAMKNLNDIDTIVRGRKGFVLILFLVTVPLAFEISVLYRFYIDSMSILYQSFIGLYLHLSLVSYDTFLHSSFKTSN